MGMTFFSTAQQIFVVLHGQREKKFH